GRRRRGGRRLQRLPRHLQGEVSFLRGVLGQRRGNAPFIPSRRAEESASMTTLDNDVETQARLDFDNAEHRLVWDWPVRLFHWSLVAAFVGAFVTNRLGVAYFKYHVWCGYAVVTLVSFRILWGLFGTKHARFWHFVRGPHETLRYARDLWRG